MSTERVVAVLPCDKTDIEFVTLSEDETGCEALRRLVDCDTFQAVCITDDLEFYVDEEGVWNDKQPNQCEQKLIDGKWGFLGNAVLMREGGSVTQDDIDKLEALVDADLKRRASFAASF